MSSDTAASRGRRSQNKDPANVGPKAKAASASKSAGTSGRALETRKGPRPCKRRRGTDAAASKDIKGSMSAAQESRVSEDDTPTMM